MATIDLVETNMRGAVVVWGVIGIRQYYGYTKTEARRMYLEECKRKVFFNQKKER